MSDDGVHRVPDVELRQRLAGEMERFWNQPSVPFSSAPDQIERAMPLGDQTALWSGELANKVAVDEAAKAHAARSQRAHDVLLDRNPDGSLPIRMAPQDVKLFADLENLRDDGVITAEQCLLPWPGRSRLHCRSMTRRLSTSSASRWPNWSLPGLNLKEHVMQRKPPYKVPGKMPGKKPGKPMKGC